MKKVSLKELNEDFIEDISKEWMLITAGTPEKFNTMTASWGGTGFIWNQPVAFAFVRPERYTYQFVEEQPMFTLSFLGKEHRSIYNLCGSKSGRDIDKVKATGLKPVITDMNQVTFEQARLTLECRKLYADDFKADKFIDHTQLEKWYGEGHGGLHRMYIAEIVQAWIKE